MKPAECSGLMRIRKTVLVIFRVVAIRLPHAAGVDTFYKIAPVILIDRRRKQERSVNIKWLCEHSRSVAGMLKKGNTESHQKRFSIGLNSAIQIIC